MPNIINKLLQAKNMYISFTFHLVEEAEMGEKDNNFVHLNDKMAELIYSMWFKTHITLLAYYIRGFLHLALSATHNEITPNVIN